jgi:hypothetical protein
MPRHSVGGRMEAPDVGGPCPIRRGSSMLENHDAAASSGAPTTHQYVAVLSIIALFALGVLTLVGIL